MITLYDYEMSAECYKVRAVLDYLDLEYDSIALEEFVPDDPSITPVVALNDQRVVPNVVLHQPVAAMLHLADTYDAPGSLLPRSDPARRAIALDWLLFSQSLSNSAGAARRHEAFGEPLDIGAAREKAHRLLNTLDRHLWFGEQLGHDFVAEEFSLADIACFPDVALSDEGGIDRRDYPAVRRWCDRVKRVPRMSLMPGIFPASPARVL